MVELWNIGHEKWIDVGGLISDQCDLKLEWTSFLQTHHSIIPIFQYSKPSCFTNLSQLKWLGRKVSFSVINEQREGVNLPLLVLFRLYYFKRPSRLNIFSQSLAMVSMASLAVPLPPTTYSCQFRWQISNSSAYSGTAQKSLTINMVS